MREPNHIFLRNLLGLAVAFAVLGAATAARAQKEAPKVPYDSIASNGVSYAGPGRESSFDLPGQTIRIGILAPTHGPEKADGEAIITAAKMALQDASKRPFPNGRNLALSVADESVPPWGLLGDEIIHLVVQERVVAILTGADGVAAHLSEQIGNKMGVPTLTLSSDDSTTEINMPWIFRLGPSDAQQAQVMVHRIYQALGLRRVILVVGKDHDGVVGGQEFKKLVHHLGFPPPVSVVINPLQPNPDSLLALIKSHAPQALVFWTQPENARKLLQALRTHAVYTPVYLSQETAQIGSGLEFPRYRTGEEKDPTGVDVYAAESRQGETSARQSFVRRYQLATGNFPSPVAAEAYDAVRLIAHALRDAGPNRARVRDRIAINRNFAGVSGRIAFDNQGNNRTNVYLVRLR